MARQKRTKNDSTKKTDNVQVGLDLSSYMCISFFLKTLKGGVDK